MSWSEDLLDGSFRGVPIDVIDDNLQAQRFIAQHGTPYVNGDTSEDLGRAARIFAMRLVAFGDNYEIDLQRLLTALDVLGGGELVHPVYGSVKALVHSFEVKHSAERPDYAEVSVQFVEQLPDAPFFDRTFVPIYRQGSSIEDVLTWQRKLFNMLAKVDSLVSQIQTWIGGGWVGLVETALGLPGIGLRLQQLRTQILGVTSGVAAMARNPLSAFDPLVDLARTPTELRSAIASHTPSSSQGLLALEGVPSALPGAETLAPAAAQIAAPVLTTARQGVELSAADQAIMLSVLNGATNNASGTPVALGAGQMPADPVTAVGLALVVLIVTELAVNHAEAAAVVLEAEAGTPTLSPDEIEALVNLPRSLIESAILLHRQFYPVETALPVIEALRELAALVLETARGVILQRPPLIERTVTSPTSLRLLAFRWYGDHGRAPELLRLNPGLRSPHNIATGEVLRGYAE
nr:DNA circularization N-terminal domain-containing protein [uncultured Pseudomonas sp.]